MPSAFANRPLKTAAIDIDGNWLSRNLSNEERQNY